jgi:hypothetical protein
VVQRRWIAGVWVDINRRLVSAGGPVGFNRSNLAAGKCSAVKRGKQSHGRKLHCGAGGPGTDSSEFERELAAAVAGDVEREEPDLGVAADLLAFIVTYKSEILLGLSFATQALQIVDRLIELAGRRGANYQGRGSGARGDRGDGPTPGGGRLGPRRAGAVDACGRLMSSATPPDQTQLQRSFTLMQQVHAAMMPAYQARRADAADALDKRDTLCGAIRTLVAAVAAGQAAADGLSMDIIVNEFGVLGDLLAAAGRFAEAEAAFDEAAMYASSLGTPAHKGQGRDQPGDLPAETRRWGPRDAFRDARGPRCAG